MRRQERRVGLDQELVLRHELGRLAAGFLADVIAVPGDPSRDIAKTLDVRFVMKGGRVYRSKDVDGTH